MSLICLFNGETRNATNYSPSEWEDLKLSVKAMGFEITLPCCGSTAVPKAGTVDRCQHFAHKPNEACNTDTWGDYEGRDNRRRRNKAPESKHHLRVKDIVCDVAQKAGWNATLEATGASETGDAWRADVLAEKDGQKVAFEVQTSPITFADYRTRQQRYRDSGVKCVWLAMITPEYSDQEIPVFELSYHKSLYVIDFPDFFSSSLLGLTDNFRGVPVGEFVLLILQNKVLWNAGWMVAEDTLARTVLANRRRRLFSGGELPPEYDEIDDSTETSVKDFPGTEIQAGGEQSHWDRVKVSHKGVGSLDSTSEQKIEPPQKAVFVETDKPTVMAGVRVHGFMSKCSCGGKTLSFKKLRIDPKQECGSPDPHCLFLDLVTDYKSLWSLVPEEYVREHLGKAEPNICVGCGTFHSCSPVHQSSLPVCLEFNMPVATELINRTRSKSQQTFISPYPLEQFVLSEASFKRWWFYPV